ncbi:MAG: hypothetical protein FIA92_03425 [Chloroflexi bacterium]|nr:hypothetical protein [Chloroflexota bacterium]
MATWTGSDGGVDWRLELDRDLLLPGRLVEGRVVARASRGVEARGVVVALIGKERWKHRVTRTDSEGHTTTHVVTSEEEVRRVPVAVSGPVTLAAGETLDRTFELPVPPMGPASLLAEVARLEWRVEAKFDIEGGLDSSIEADVVVAQPSALIRAGAVHVGQFALFEGAEAASDDIAASISLEPAPLVCGAPFHGSLAIRAPGSRRLQEIRAELRLAVEATVQAGEREEITGWTGRLSDATELAGDPTFEVAGALPTTPLPTIELPHARTQATFHVILAQAWARDPHLVRDVAIATTAEL